MNTPSVSPGSLRARLVVAGRLPERFVADDIARVSLAALLAEANEAAGEATIRARTILLACERQLATVRALVALDGRVGRIVLCPPDLPPQHLPPVLAGAAVDAIVSDRAWPDASAGGRPVIDAGQLGARATRAPENLSPPTEWIMFTSGTTGPPKMVVHTLDSLAGHLPAGAPQGKPPVWCTFYDIRRYGGLQILLRALVGGGSLVLSSAGEPPGAFMARAARDAATHFLGTPSHWRRVLMTDEPGRISPNYVRLSGEVADQTILDRLHTLFPQAKLVHAFASTETGVAFEVEDGRAGFAASLLEHTPGAELRVRDGSLWVRSARVAAGRLGGVQDGFADEDGFVDTGDIVERRDDRCYFAGRKEGIVNVGGQKVHPEEVETVINSHPGVLMSLVRSRRSPITGAVVVAEIVARRGTDGEEPVPSEILTGEILDMCRRDLAPFKVPAMVRIVPSLEIAASGKLVRPRA